MIIVILLLPFIFFQPAIAAPQISLLSYPEKVNVGDTFAINFNVASLDIGYTYHFKAMGDTNTDISIYPACASRYDDCSNIIISNPATNSASAYLKFNLASAFNQIKIRLVQSDKHSPVFDSDYINIISLQSDTSPSSEAKTDSFASLIITEIMANPQEDSLEWIEIYNPADSPIVLTGLCFYDASAHSRCFDNNTSINSKSFTSLAFSSGFLNNDGDSVSLADNSVTYPNSPEGYSYSRQENSSWCFADSSQNSSNNSCASFTDSDPTATPPPPTPVLSLQIFPDYLYPGDDFNLVFSLNSAEEYSLRLLSPFTSQYASFSDYEEGYSWLTLPLSLPKKINPGLYPLTLRLKKDSNSRLTTYELGQLKVVEKPSPTPEGEVLGTLSDPTETLISSPSAATASLSSSLHQVSRNISSFSWLFLFAGSILLLSPLLFPKLFRV